MSQIGDSWWAAFSLLATITSTLLQNMKRTLQSLPITIQQFKFFFTTVFLNSHSNDTKLRKQIVLHFFPNFTEDKHRSTAKENCKLRLLPIGKPPSRLYFIFWLLATLSKSNFAILSKLNYVFIEKLFKVLFQGITPPCTEELLKILCHCIIMYRCPPFFLWKKNIQLKTQVGYNHLQL